jgi:hypothetical protein
MEFKWGLNHLLGYNDGRSEPNTHTSIHIMKGIDILFHLAILFFEYDLRYYNSDLYKLIKILLILGGCVATSRGEQKETAKGALQ